MDHSVHNKIVNFIWSIADDCLRDVYVRGKYRDVILPMFVLRRLDCLLEATKKQVTEEVAFQMEEFGILQDPGALQDAAGYVFYNTADISLKDLTGNPSQLASNFKHYLDSFSDNVQEIIRHFDLYNQASKLVGADKLHDVLEKFVSPDINLSSKEAKAEGRTLPALTNHGMGYVFEELIRKFNEENNEEAGEHFTPREVIKLMTHLLFLFVIEGKEIQQARFQVNLPDFQDVYDWYPAVPRSSDGQLLFLMEMVSKMKSVKDNGMGARIASVHNGSSLFTGDAGSGESNIRRYLVERDYLEAIIQLPNNLFYNTGITTYIWLLNNNKPAHRKGKVQLINAQTMHRKLRKNLGEKNCELTDEHVNALVQLYHEMAGNEAENPVSNVFANSDFGYFKVTIERPLRKSAQFSGERIQELRFLPALQHEMQWIYAQYGDAVYDQKTLKAQRNRIIQHFEEQSAGLTKKNRDKLLAQATWDDQKSLMENAEKIMAEVGQVQTDDFNQFKKDVDKALKVLELKLSAGEKNQLLNAVSWRDENAKPVINKVQKVKPTACYGDWCSLANTQRNDGTLNGAIDRHSPG